MDFRSLHKKIYNQEKDYNTFNKVLRKSVFLLGQVCITLTLVDYIANTPKTIRVHVVHDEEKS